MKNMMSLGRYGTIGLELAISICLGLWGGQWFDKRWGTSYMVWIGLIVGTYAGFRSVFKAARDAQRAIEKEDREEPGKYRALEDGEVDELEEEATARTRSTGPSAQPGSSVSKKEE